MIRRAQVSMRSPVTAIPRVKSGYGLYTHALLAEGRILT
jgi:hypothetical protein